MPFAMSNVDIQFIVDRLNEPPFGDQERLTLVTLDEKKDTELLQLLNYVFGILSPQQQKDLRDENPEDTSNRMLDFLWILNYRPNMPQQQFKEALIGGSKECIYPILHYCLSRVPDLQRRAYLARFLVNIDVPEEMFADEVVVEVYERYGQLQQQFKETHKHVEKCRTTTVQPEEAKKEIQRLEEDKEQLGAKISKIKQRVQAEDDFETLYQKARALRLEQGEERALSERLNEQKQQLILAEQKFKKTQERYRDAQASLGEETATQMLDRLEAETKLNRERVQETIVRELREKQERIKNVENILAQPAISEADLSAAQTQIRQLASEVGVLQEKHNKMQHPGDEQLAMYKQQAQGVAKKKAEKEEQLRMLEDQQKSLKNQLQDKEEQFDSSKGTKMLNGAEFKRYADSLRSKSTQVKQCKQKLADLRAERGVLNRTEQLLKSRNSHLAEFNEEMERKKGVQGYHNAREQLEHISAVKSAVDEEKGKTLEEISRVVTEINNSIKERKSKLAPQIKELRSVRSKYQELESEYLEKKAVYDNTALGLDGERSKLEQEVKTLRTECNAEESRYHYLNCLSGVADVAMSRVFEEVKKTDKAGNEAAVSWKDIYQSKVQSQENLSKALREEQKRAKESHEPNMKQRLLFLDLKKLMECKLSTYQNRSDDQKNDMGMGLGMGMGMGMGMGNMGNMGSSFGMGGMNSMRLDNLGDEQGVDRLVIG